MDGLGYPLKFLLTGGQRHDITQGPKLIEAFKNAILIGDKGSRIKKIGQQARLDLENILECKVMLKLWVKVKSGWSDDSRALKSLGYDD